MCSSLCTLIGKKTKLFLKQIRIDGNGDQSKTHASEVSNLKTKLKKKKLTRTKTNPRPAREDKPNQTKTKSETQRTTQSTAGGRRTAHDGDETRGGATKPAPALPRGGAARARIRPISPAAASI